MSDSQDDLLVLQIPKRMWFEFYALLEAHPGMKEKLFAYIRAGQDGL